MNDRCASGRNSTRAHTRAFLEAAEEAFGSPPDRELRAQLLLAFHKIVKNKADAFLSNSQQATKRRGFPRPRRPRPSVEGATTKAQSEGELELEPGKHKITLQLANHLHESYGKDFAKTITVNVKADSLAKASKPMSMPMEEGCA